MNKFYSTVLFCSSLLLCSASSNAQSNIISTIAGNGTLGYSGDGGAATAAKLDQPAGIALDGAGNKYFSDAGNNCIRKINTAGIITTIAGVGVPGFTGDGGPASSAQMNGPIGLAVDASGNIFIGDQLNKRVRKINTSGVITTVAGNGTATFTGGVAATSTGIGQVGGIALDAAGNLYFASMSHRVFKVDGAGIITSIAGTGIAGFSGDGGAATAATLNEPWDITIDASGNIYVCELINNRIRKINTSGIIATIAGNGTTAYGGEGAPATATGIYMPQGITFDNSGNLFFGDRMNSRVRVILTSGSLFTAAGNGTTGFSGDGGPAKMAQISDPTGVAYNPANGDLYISDNSNSRIRKVNVSPFYTSDSFSLVMTTTCGNIAFTAATKSYTTGMTIVTKFGDGSSITTPVTAGFIGTGGAAAYNHGYATNGTYTIKHILKRGATAIDSIRHSYNYILCNTIAVNFFIDANNDCQFQSNTEPHVSLPITVEIDSNGVAVNTIVTPGAFNFVASGNPGDIYAVKVISAPAGLTTACPPSGIIYDTIKPVTFTSNYTNDIGFNCSSATGFDLGVHASTRSGKHAFAADMLVDNMYCSPKNGALTLTMSSKYDYYSSNLTPAGTSGRDVNWNLVGLTSAAPGPAYVHVFAEIPSGPALLPGDTIHSSFKINPMTGDGNSGDNNENEVDTVVSSFDPNYIAVTPIGCIPSAATDLEFAIGFENTGNDTAHNIYVMDTLSTNLDPATVRVIGASSNMQFSTHKSGTQTVLKFDFPNIMLPDSTHHNLCHGALFYTIKTRAGIADGTQIHNRAGIYFDDNEVVMTNSSTNIVNCPIDKTGTAQLQTNNKITLYPNPANDLLTINTGNNQFTTYSITNQIGQTLLQDQTTNTHSTINIKSLAPGMYFITLEGEDGSVVRKFVKE